MGFEKFKDGQEFKDEVERIAASLPKKEATPYFIISRTPMESLWTKNGDLCRIGQDGPVDDYNLVAWGDDVPTPCGPLPALIVAVRHDIAIKIDPSFATKDDIHVMPGPANLRKLETKKPLMGPDWKPAPGFERPW